MDFILVFGLKQHSAGIHIYEITLMKLYSCHCYSYVWNLLSEVRSSFPFFILCTESIGQQQRLVKVFFHWYSLSLMIGTYCDK